MILAGRGDLPDGLLQLDGIETLESGFQPLEGRAAQTTWSGSSFCPVGPTWISVPISGQTPQS